MSRIRSIKPELLKDEKTATLDHATWRLFVSLILQADDYGNLHASVRLIASETFWGTEDGLCGSREGLARVSRMLRQLHELALVRLYTVEGQSYAHLSGWAKHQKVDHPAKNAPIPGPDHPKALTLPGYGSQSAVDEFSPEPTGADRSPPVEVYEAIREPEQEPSRDPREASRDLRESLGKDRIGEDRNRRGEDRISICAETAPPSSPPVEPEGLAEPSRSLVSADPALAVFPCDGTPKTWALTQKQVDEWRASFPSLDVEGQCRQALAWVQAAPSRRKTASGMGRFLVGWLGRAQNSGAGRVNGASPPAGAGQGWSPEEKQKRSLEALHAYGGDR